MRQRMSRFAVLCSVLLTGMALSTVPSHADHYPIMARFRL